MAAASIFSLDVPCSGSSTILRSVRKTLELRLRKKRRWREGEVEKVVVKEERKTRRQNEKNKKLEGESEVKKKVSNRKKQGEKKNRAHKDNTKIQNN